MPAQVMTILVLTINHSAPEHVDDQLTSNRNILHMHPGVSML
jgi:hypothetical protein